MLDVIMEFDSWLVESRDRNKLIEQTLRWSRQFQRPVWPLLWPVRLWPKTIRIGQQQERLGQLADLDPRLDGLLRPIPGRWNQHLR